MKTHFGVWKCPNCGDPFQKYEQTSTLSKDYFEDLHNKLVKGDTHAIELLIELLKDPINDTRV